MFPPDHALRATLADEVHARPPEPMQAPARASYVAVLLSADKRTREVAHIAALCAMHGVEPPAAGATHFRTPLGPLRLKWERHGEFSGYTVIAPGLGARPFDGVAAAGLPPHWLAAIPGATVAAVHAELHPRRAFDENPQALAGVLASIFDGQAVVGSDIAEGAGSVYTDFRLHQGCTRFLLVDHDLTERQGGRTLQRLFEIEAYRLMALLALLIARRQSPRIVEIETALDALTDSIAQAHVSNASTHSGANAGASAGAEDEALLQELTRLAAEVESGLAASQFRFGACRAYYELVMRRVAELRETRLPGMQTLDEFMARRFTPAVATCTTVSQRLYDLSERVAQASSLLSTRGDIARERQNQSLLASMNRRAQMQLRLQQTVEGLSVAAISYYLVGLVGYAAKGLKAADVPVNADLAMGLSIPVVALVVMVALRRARRRLAAQDDAPAPPA